MVNGGRRLVAALIRRWGRLRWRGHSGGRAATPRCRRPRRRPRLLHGRRVAGCAAEGGARCGAVRAGEPTAARLESSCTTSALRAPVAALGEQRERQQVSGRPRGGVWVPGSGGEGRRVGAWVVQEATRSPWAPSAAPRAGLRAASESRSVAAAEPASPLGGALCSSASTSSDCHAGGERARTGLVAPSTTPEPGGGPKLP